MTEFYKTIMGRQFFDQSVPRIGKALEAIATGIEESNRLKERELNLKEEELALREQALKKSGSPG